MKKVLFLILIIASLLLVSCSSSSKDSEKIDFSNFNGNVQDLTPKQYEEYMTYVQEKQAEMTNNQGKDVNQELVNFKCDIQNTGTIYFLKGDGVVKTPSSTTWVLNGYTYAKIPLENETVLVKYEKDEGMGLMSTQDMIDTYKNSNMNPAVTCTLGAVTQQDMTLPNLRIITNQELKKELMNAMLQQ